MLSTLIICLLLLKTKTFRVNLGRVGGVKDASQSLSQLHKVYKSSVNISVGER